MVLTTQSDTRVHIRANAMMGVSCLIPRQSREDEAHVRKSKAIFIVCLRRPFFLSFSFLFLRRLRENDVLESSHPDSRQSTFGFGAIF